MRYRITASGSSGSRAPETMMTVEVPGYRIADFCPERYLGSESADVLPGRCLGSESAILVQEDILGSEFADFSSGNFAGKRTRSGSL